MATRAEAQEALGRRVADQQGQRIAIVLQRHDRVRAALGGHRGLLRQPAPFADQLRGLARPGGSLGAAAIGFGLAGAPLDFGQRVAQIDQPVAVLGDIGVDLREPFGGPRLAGHLPQHRGLARAVEPGQRRFAGGDLGADFGQALGIGGAAQPALGAVYEISMLITGS